MSPEGFAGVVSSVERVGLPRARAGLPIPASAAARAGCMFPVNGVGPTSRPPFSVSRAFVTRVLGGKTR